MSAPAFRKSEAWVSDLLADLLSGPWPVDVALAALAVEAVVLVARARRRGAPFSWPASWPRALWNVVLVLGPGACLMLALREALTGGSMLVVALWLAASLPLHLADLRRRGL